MEWEFYEFGRMHFIHDNLIEKTPYISNKTEEMTK